MARPKLMICGHGRHGKDTVAALFERLGGYTFTSSSWAAAELFYQQHADEYESLEACYADRGNRRQEWRDFITAYNTPDKTRLMRTIYARSDIYVGIRCPVEFLAGVGDRVFDLSIWVDRSKVLPAERTNGVTREMCDIVLDNNGDEQDLFPRVLNLVRALRA